MKLCRALSLARGTHARARALTPFAPRAMSLSSEYRGVLGGEGADPAAEATFRAWHAAIEAGMTGGDPKPLLRPHVHGRCVFKPPTYVRVLPLPTAGRYRSAKLVPAQFKPWKGAEEMLVILEGVGEVFGPSFTYGRQWLSPDARSWALEFTADIAGSGKLLEGIDLVTLDVGAVLERAAPHTAPLRPCKGGGGPEAGDADCLTPVTARIAPLVRRRRERWSS